MSAVPRLAFGMALLLACAAQAPADTDLFGDPLPSGARARLGSTRFRYAGQLQALRYTADGNLLLLSAFRRGLDHDQALYLLQATTGKRLRRLSAELRESSTSDWRSYQSGKEGGRRVSACRWCFSPDGRLLAQVADGDELDEPTGWLRVEELATGKVLFELNEGKSYFTYICFTPDGKQLAAIDETPASRERPASASVRVWDLASRNEAAPLTMPRANDAGPGFMPDLFTFSPDGKLVAAVGSEAGDHGIIRLWDRAGKKGSWRLDGQANADGPLAFSPDGKTLAEAGGAAVRLWDARTGKQFKELQVKDEEPFGGRCAALDFSPDGRRLLAVAGDEPGGGGSKLHLWELPAGRVLPSPVETGVCLFSSDGRHLAILYAEWIYLCNAATGKVRHKLEADRPAATETVSSFAAARQGLGLPIAFSPDSATLAAGSPTGVVRRWRVADGTLLPTAGDNRGQIQALAYAADGVRVATSDGERVHVWDARGQLRATLTRPAPAEKQKGEDEAEKQAVLAVAFSARDSTVVAGWNDGVVTAWDAATAKLHWEKRVHEGEVRAFAPAPDGETLISGDEKGRLVWWDLAAGKPRRTQRLDERLAGFSTDGRLALTTADHQAKVWELTTGKVRRVLTVGKAWTALSPDGRFLTARDMFRGTRLLDVASGNPVRDFAKHGDAVAFFPGGGYLTLGGDDGSVDLCETETGTVVRTLSGSTGASLTGLVVARDGRTLATAEADGTVLLWDMSGLPRPTPPGPPPAPPRTARADAHGEPLPPGARQRLGSLAFRHARVVKTLRYLPDGKTLLTDSDTGDMVMNPGGFKFPGHGLDALMLWDAATGRLRARRTAVLESSDFGEPRERGEGSFVLIPGWSVSADGTVLATKELKRQVSEAIIEVTELATGRVRCRITDAKDEPDCLQLSPDGKLLAVAYRKAETLVRFYDARTGLEVGQLARGQKEATLRPVGLQFSSDGGRLAVRMVKDDKWDAVWVLDRTRQDAPVRLAAAKWRGGPVAFSPDGKALALLTSPWRTGKARITLWDPATGKQLRDLGSHPTPSAGLVFAPDGKTLVSLLTDEVRWWDLEAGKALPRLHDKPATAAVFAPDGRTLALAVSKAIYLFDVVRRERLRELPGSSGRNNFDDAQHGLGMSLGFSADGKVLAAADGTGIRRWDVASGRELNVAEATEPARAVAVSADGRLVAVRGDEQLYLWDADAGKVRFRLSARAVRGQERSALYSLALSPDGKLLAVGWFDGRVILHETGDGKERWQAKGHERGVFSLRFTADGRGLLSGGQDLSAAWWDVVAGRVTRRANLPAELRPEVSRYPPYGQSFRAEDPAQRLRLGDPSFRGHVVLASDGQLFAFTGKTVQLWGLSPVQARWRQPAKFGLGAQIAFSPDRTTLAVGGLHGAVHLLDVRDGKELRFFSMPESVKDVSSLAFSPDGKFLAAAGYLLSAGEEDLCVWETATGTILGTRAAHRGGTRALAFTADGRRLVSAGEDTTVLLWDVAELTARPAPAALSAAELSRLWEQMADADAGKAYTALCGLRQHPGPAVALVSKHLKPVPPADAARLARLVAELAGERFADRQKAMTELEQLEDPAEPALRRELANDPPLELRRRVEQLLTKLAGPVTRPDQIRALRAIELLERVGSDGARAALQTLARGAPEARLTREAQGALRRLAGRSTDVR
jgi:WD40 repeat protein